ncbi:hypothetical protein PI124_g9597 [Phytophthora idaei]|nr:hypothetical protein PI125_g9851 [Phytophthora idaei]KAG3155257.1 hypothetical protein PI126_g9262 [Phytophthora idaei]KAG3245675.1 hypothetical protein PI124_g9597 [Phytophthora idaei]
MDEIDETREDVTIVEPVNMNDMSSVGELARDDVLTLLLQTTVAVRMSRGVVMEDGEAVATETPGAPVVTAPLRATGVAAVNLMTDEGDEDDLIGVVDENGVSNDGAVTGETSMIGDTNDVVHDASNCCHIERVSKTWNYRRSLLHPRSQCRPGLIEWI